MSELASVYIVSAARTPIGELEKNHFLPFFLSSPPMNAE